MSTPSEIDPKEIVGALVKGLEVIRSFSAENSEMTMAQVAQITGLSRATARRSLLTLQSMGYVKLQDRDYSLTPKVLELGYSYLSGLTFVERLDPIIAEAARLTGESCSLSVLNDLEVVYVARRTNNHIMSVTLNVGTRLPASLTSMGRVLLSQQNDTELAATCARFEYPALTRQSVTSPEALYDLVKKAQAQGWALVDQELEEGLRSLAVPLYNGRGQLVAALNVGCSALKVSTGKMINEYLAILQEAARQAKSLIE